MSEKHTFTFNFIHVSRNGHQFCRKRSLPSLRYTRTLYKNYSWNQMAFMIKSSESISEESPEGCLYTILFHPLPIFVVAPQLLHLATHFKAFAVRLKRNQSNVASQFQFRKQDTHRNRFKNPESKPRISTSKHTTNRALNCASTESKFDQLFVVLRYTVRIAISIRCVKHDSAYRRHLSTH